MHSIVLLVILVVVGLAGCVSRSTTANSATSMMGDWSPVGSQHITRQRQFVLPSHYRLYVGRLEGGLSTGDYPDLNQTTSAELARYLRRYFVEVDVAGKSQSLASALKGAAAVDADVLLLPRLESWPSIKPVGSSACETKPDQAGAAAEACAESADGHGELALSVAIYDVRARHQIDIVSAHGQRGAAAFLAEKKFEDLQSLCSAIASQLAVQGRVE